MFTVPIKVLEAELNFTGRKNPVMTLEGVELFRQTLLRETPSHGPFADTFKSRLNCKSKIVPTTLYRRRRRHRRHWRRRRHWSHWRRRRRRRQRLDRRRRNSCSIIKSCQASRLKASAIHARYGQDKKSFFATDNALSTALVGRMTEAKNQRTVSCSYLAIAGEDIYVCI